MQEKVERRPLKYGPEYGLGNPFTETESERIRGVITKEERLFARTLDRGEKRLSRIIERLRKQGLSVITGKDAFLMHDTYGYPIWCTRMDAEEAGFTVDEKGFQALMDEQKARSRQAHDEKLIRLQETIE